MQTDASKQRAFREAVAADKGKHADSKSSRNKSPYTLGWWGQVKTLTKRQFQLKLQDRFHIVTSYGLAWVRDESRVIREGRF
jgi:hypothetical protein